MIDAPSRKIDPRWAWQRYAPSPDAPWDLKKVGHLYRRAAFGANINELENSLRIGPERAVDELLRGRPDPEGDEVWGMIVRGLGPVNNGDQLAAAWLYRMLYTTHPLREKMTLFWHNHFATSNRKVQNATYMLGQNELLRRHALGDFRTLLQEVSRDPAMMVWLDTNQSRRGQANENYARELMELFSLGLRHPRRPDQRNYSEQDVREAARAFTGWSLESGRAVFHAAQHDDGEKNILGQRGRFASADVVRLCLAQDAAPYFITRKVFRFLVSETWEPAPELLEPLALAFRANDYDFGKLVDTILRSNLFFSPSAYRARVKSPVDFALGIVRGLEGHLPGAGHERRLGTTALASAMDGLGQRLFYPPSVAGWDMGRAWLNSQTLLLRQNLALSLSATTDDRFGRRADPAALLRRHNCHGAAEQVDFLTRLFLQGDLDETARQRLVEYLEGASRQTYPFFWGPEDASDQRSRALCHLVLCLPEFQLD